MRGDRWPNEINRKKQEKTNAPPAWAFGPMGLISSAPGEPQRETQRLQPTETGNHAIIPGRVFFREKYIKRRTPGQFGLFYDEITKETMTQRQKRHRGIAKRRQPPKPSNKTRLYRLAAPRRADPPPHPPLCAALLLRRAAESPRHATPLSRHADRRGTAAPPPPRDAGPLFCRSKPSRAQPARRGTALN